MEIKTYTVKTRLPPELVKEFEDFYETTHGSYMGRRLRDMLVEYCKTSSAREDNFARMLLGDMYTWFCLIDACEDTYAGRLNERDEMEGKMDGLEV